MIATIFKKTVSLSIALALTLLMLVAVYVSVGRQLMPYVVDYREDIESQLTASIGQQVQIGAIEGGWRRFNPVLTLQQVLIFPTLASATEQLVLLDNLSLEIDTLASLLQRKLILRAVEIANPEFTLREDASGRWQISGFEASPGTQLTLDQVLELSSRVSNLSLSNLVVSLVRNDGRTVLFERSRLQLQNRGAQHYMHAELLQAGVIGPVSIAAELTGNTSDTLSGQLYVRFPENDYSGIVSGLAVGGAQLQSLAGTSEMWAKLEGGQLHSAQGNVALSKLGLGLVDGGPVVELSDAGTRFFVQRQQETSVWEVWAQDLRMQLDAVVWRESSAYLKVVPDASVELIADSVNVGLLSAIVTQLDVLEPLADVQLSEHNPRGELQNLNLRWLMAEDANSAAQPRLSLSANLSDVSINARDGVPSLWGMDGYLEVGLDATSQRLTGLAEVDSSRFMMQLPDMFTDVWAYDRVNGRVNFALDMEQGQHLRFVSSVIVAENDMLKGHARFATDFRKTSETERTSTLDLMVGLAEGDISRKSVYLPRGPKVPENLRNVMNWIDGAIVGGDAFSSGLIYRGSVLPGTTDTERTLQLVFNVEDGTLVYGPDWPALEQLEGHVVIADHNVDIHVSSGQTLGLGFDATNATIRPNAQGRGSFLAITGRGHGTASQAMAFLAQAPATRGIGALIQNWEGFGNVNLGLGLGIPLDVPGSQPGVDVALQLQGNALNIPEFDLQFDAISGDLHFNTQTGLQGDALQASLFGEPVTVTLSSAADAGRTTTTAVDISGKVSVQALSAWPRQSRFVVDLLSRIRGEMDYVARLDVVQPAAGPDTASGIVAQRRLNIQSALQGVQLDYPAPFKKAAGDTTNFSLDIDFLDDRQEIRASLAELASLNIGIADGRVRDGLVYLGAQDQTLNVRRLNASAPGIDVVGSLPELDLQAWIDTLRSPAPAGAGTGTSTGTSAGFGDFRDALNLADVTVGSLHAFGQTAPAVNVQVLAEDRAWHFALASDMIAGDVRLPFVRSVPLQVHLTHLHLPAPEAPEPPELNPELANFMGPPEPPERIDALQDIDPRRFVAMQFSADSIMRGEADFGRWAFALHPTPAGAEFTDVVIEARGIRAGREAEEGRFLWTYDGKAHHSYMNAVLEAGDLGAVLSAFGYAPSLQSTSAVFNASLDWPGSPAFFASTALSGNLDMRINEGRFLQGSAGAANSALKLISIINFDAVMRRLRFSDDLLRSGLSYEQILGEVELSKGVMTIQDRLQIIGPASLFQIAGQIDLTRQTIDGSMFITLPISDNIPWMSGIAVLNNLINWQVAVGVFLFDQIFGDQVDSLTSAQYILQGPWEGLEPRLSQVFGAPGTDPAPGTAPAAPPLAPAGDASVPQA